MNSNFKHSANPSIRLATEHDVAKHKAELITLLQDSVHGGASVGFLPPLSTQDAAAYWDSVAEAIGHGSRWLWLAMDDEGIIGAVQLDLATRANALHRAEVCKLLVRSDARRQGLASLLMQTLESHAQSNGRTTLVLDTRAGDPSEMVYARLGWQKSGEIPKYARSADGTLHETAFYFKLL